MNTRCQDVLDRVLAAVEPVVGRGRIPDEIPALASVDLRSFGLALATVDGAVRGVGDWEAPFSIQSLSKVFALALVLGRDGDRTWTRVGREPSSHPFNSLRELESCGGIPRNPFVNAGALVVVDRLLDLTGDARHALRDFLRAESGADVDFDKDVALSEAAHAHRNAAVANLLAGYGNLRHPGDVVLQHYIWQCSIAMSCRELAVAGAFLARAGVRGDGTRLLSASDARSVNATMMTCGTYESVGEFAHRVGLPGKSGVGGGILAVVPGRCAIAVWSPGLDLHGTSIAGVAALEALTAFTGWSVF
ncbi:glutaminase [Nonomuraea sp. NPDC050556]|uniref:glutaminase n=1 Tax=Nonomuraea sp. NPDC050556 TaxID=3364369 RepID=UPI0037A97F01